MSKFKNIEKLGLSVFGMDVIKAEDLEALLQSAHVIYSTREPNERTGSALWDEGYKISHTHSALLLMVKPIKKKTKAEAALEFVSDLFENSHVRTQREIKEQAKRILEMKDEV